MNSPFGRVNNPTLANFINLKGHSSYDEAVSNKPSAKDKLIASNIINELIATIPAYDEFDNIMNPHPYNWLWESAYPFTNQHIEALARKFTSHHNLTGWQDDEYGIYTIEPNWEEWQGKLLIRRADADDENYKTYLERASTNMPYLDIMYISLVNVWDDNWNNRWINKYYCPICEHDYKLKDTSAEPTIEEFRHRIQIEECPNCFEVVPTWKKYHKNDEMLVYNLRVFGGSNQYPKNAEEQWVEWIALYDGHSFGDDMTHIKDIDYFKGWYDATSLITNILRPHKLNMLINWHMKLPEGF